MLTPLPLSVPPLLAPGARVALIAASSPLTLPDDLDRASDNVRTLGWVPVLGPHARSRWGYFAGTDAERLADLQWALDAPECHAIWFIRGGYGITRIVDRLDFGTFVRRPKPVIGYSDVTALHAAVAARCRLVSYHGPVTRESLSALSRTSLVRAVTEGADSCGFAPGAQLVRGGRTIGRLAGGNLSLVASLCGTPYAVTFDGAIALFEDVNEAVYRIDRLLQQIALSGALRGCVGLVFGGFTKMPLDEDTGGRELRSVFAEIARELKVPCIMDAPFGHLGDQDRWTLPLGALADLDADACTLSTLSA